MCNFKLLEKAFSTLLYSWGGNTPSEAIWAFNELLKFVEKEYNINIVEFLNEDCSNYDTIIDELESKLNV